MSVNISVSESGPINLDDILKSSINLPPSTNLSAANLGEDGEIFSPSYIHPAPVGSAKRKSKLLVNEETPSGSGTADDEPNEDHLVQTAQVLGTRTLRTIADISPVSMYVSAPDVRKRQSYTLIFKRECVRRMRHGGISINQMSRETGIDRRCLRSWLKQEAQLGEESQVECTRKRVSGAGRKIAYPQLETKLDEWYEAEIKAGREVTYRKMSVYIYRLAKECGAPNPLKYSKEFFVKWQKKNGLVCKAKNADANIASSTKDYESDCPAPKSLMDILFEGLDESILGRLDSEETRASETDPELSTSQYPSLASILINQPPVQAVDDNGESSNAPVENGTCSSSEQDVSLKRSKVNEQDQEEETVPLDGPPPLSPYQEDDEYDAETPPQLLAEDDNASSCALEAPPTLSFPRVSESHNGVVEGVRHDEDLDTTRLQTASNKRESESSDVKSSK